MTRTMADATNRFVDELFRDTNRKTSANVQAHKASGKTTQYITVHEGGKLRVFTDVKEVLAWLTPTLVNPATTDKTAPTVPGNHTATTNGTKEHDADKGVSINGR